MKKIFGKKYKLNEKRKIQVIKNWLASFLVTAVVVATTIISNPVPPTAEFLSLETAGTELYYAVLVNDEESVLTQNSLKIVAKSILQTKEQQIAVGESQGVLEGLFPNTEYSISVVGSKGYGEFSLEKQTIITTEETEETEEIDYYSGEILSAEFNSGQEMSACDVEVAYHNNGELKEVNLKYAYMISQQYGEGQYQAEYTSIEVTEENFSYSIDGIPKLNGSLNLILEAILQDDSVVVLDDQIYFAPIYINAGAYIDYVAETQISAIVYPDGFLENASYYAILKKESVEVQRQNIEMYEEQNYSTGYVAFYDLEPNSAYELEFYITYTNPNTQVQETQIFSPLLVLTTIYLPPVY